MDSSTDEETSKFTTKLPLSAKSIKISKQPLRKKRPQTEPFFSESVQSLYSKENSDFNLLQSTQIVSHSYYSFCQRQRVQAQAKNDLDFFQKLSSYNSQEKTIDDQRSLNEEEEEGATEKIEDIISLASKDSCSLGFASPTEEHSLAFLEINNKPHLDFIVRKEYGIRPWKYPPHISKKMRAILVDWMMEVCSDLKFDRETFFCSVDYLDRFIVQSAGNGVTKENLQLVGVTCLLISAKKEVAFTSFKIHKAECSNIK